jgi:transcriptional regulator with XRE-family HTH domain
MPLNVPDILRRLQALGFTQEELADRLGVTQAAISRWSCGAREPGGANMERLRALAAAHGLLRDESAPNYVIPIMGYIGAGAEIDTAFEQIPPEGIDQIEAPMSFAFDVIGFRVKGASMEPVYSDGDIVIVRMDRPVSAESLIGEEAVVRTSEGGRYLKHILPGSRRGRYHLASLNAAPMKDVEIHWASEVVAVLRASHATLLHRHRREDQR